MYAVNSEATNAGIPYADTFYLLNHFCILRCGSKQSRFVLFCEIKYKKSCWVKGMSFLICLSSFASIQLLKFISGSWGFIKTSEIFLFPI